MEYVAEPISRSQLRTLAYRLRRVFGLQDELYFPVVPFLEHAMPMYFEGFHYEIVQVQDLSPKKHAEIDIANRLIRIREDVYNGALDGTGRDRMTIMHEIAHYVLLIHCGVKLSRAFSEAPVKPYRDPEWQAKALAGEVMCPAHLIGQLTAEQIASRCGVSLDAAKIAWGKSTKVIGNSYANK